MGVVGVSVSAVCVHMARSQRDNSPVFTAAGVFAMPTDLQSIRRRGPKASSRVQLLEKRKKVVFWIFTKKKPKNVHNGRTVSEAT